MPLHSAPGGGLLLKLAGLDFLYLLQMVAPMGEQQLLQRVLGQIGIGARQERSNLLGVGREMISSPALGRTILLHGRTEILLDGAVVTGKQAEQLVRRRLAVEWRDGATDVLGIRDDRLLGCRRRRRVLREGREHDAADPENVTHPEIAKSCLGLRYFAGHLRYRSQLRPGEGLLSDRLTGGQQG